MEFERQISNWHLSTMVNNGATGLEYLRRHQLANNENPLAENVVGWIKQGTEACRLLLKAFELHKHGDESRTWTNERLDDWKFAEGFLKVAQGYPGFELTAWKKEARSFRAKINGYFQGRKTIPTEEIEGLQNFLNDTSSILLSGLSRQLDAYKSTRGVHYI